MSPVFDRLQYILQAITNWKRTASDQKLEAGTAWERGYQLVISLGTNLAPKPITVVFGLGMRLRMRMRTKLENGVLCAKDSSHSEL